MVALRKLSKYIPAFTCLSYQSSPTIVSLRTIVPTNSFTTIVKSHHPSTNNIRRFHTTTTTTSTTTMSAFPSTTTIQQQPPLIDVDCNILSPDLLNMFNPPVPYSIISHPSFLESNICCVVSPASNLEECINTLEFIKSLPDNGNEIQIKTTVGIHPFDVGSDIPNEEELVLLTGKIEDILKSNKKDDEKSSPISCIGEIGLDYSPGFPPREVQLPFFRRQLEIAKRLGLPVFIHERLAFDDCFMCLKEVYGNCGG